MRPRRFAGIAAIVTATAGLLAGSGVMATAANASDTFIGPLNHTKVIASTVPANGDINPYGVAVVPHSTGRLYRGDVLVSNFNDKANAQGTGTTIVEVSPHGQASLFATVKDSACPGGVGLTTALVVLRSGWVIVGEQRRHLRPRLPDRPRPVGPRQKDDLRLRHRRPVGHDSS